MVDLKKIIEKEYSSLEGELKVDLSSKKNEYLQITFKYGKDVIFYNMLDYLDEKMLYTNEISIMPDSFNADIFNKILSINYNIAKVAGARQIRTEALADDDKDILKGAGYIFSPGEYVGVKKVV